MTVSMTASKNALQDGPREVTMSDRFVVRQERDALVSWKLGVIGAAAAAIFAASIGVSVWLPGPTPAARAPGRGAEAAPSSAPATIGTLEQRLILAAPRGLETKRRQRDELDRWGWVDRDAGLARIPVERAMDLVADEAGAAP